MSRQTIFLVGIVGKMSTLHLNVTGQYVVHLPDCRTQIVDYFVDEYKQVVVGGRPVLQLSLTCFTH